MNPDEVVTPAGDIPGLVDVRLSDGREFRDLTIGQLKHLALTEPEIRQWIKAREAPQ